MRARNYLVGNLKDKKHIDYLLSKRLPGLTHYVSFVKHCENLFAWLECREVKNWDQYDLVVCEYLEWVQCDLEDTTSARSEDIMKHVTDVETALGYLTQWLDMLGLMPIPKKIEFREATALTVMIILVD